MNTILSRPSRFYFFYLGNRRRFGLTCGRKIRSGHREQSAFMSMFFVLRSKRRTQPSGCLLKTKSYKVVLSNPEARRTQEPSRSHISMSMRVNDIANISKSQAAANVGS